MGALALASRKRALLWLPLLVVAACGIIAAVGFVPNSGPGLDSPRETWERIASQMHRPIRGRLGAGHLHQACPEEAALCGPVPSPSSAEFRQLSALLARLSREPALDPDSLHIGALASLMIHGPGSIETIDRMAAAAALAPEAIAIRSDLVAARLAFAAANRGAGGDPAAGAQQELQAMREVVKLAAEAPADPAVWFNYALTLEAVGLPRLAEDAWRRFLEIEPEGEWAEEARQQLATPSELPTAPASPPEELDALAEWVAAHPLEARRYAERSLLSTWAKAEGAIEGETALRSLEVVAPILARQFNDWLLAETVEQIRRASPSKRPTFAAAVRSYFDGIAAYREQRFTDAFEGFSELRVSPARSELPLLRWVEYHLAAALYGLDRFEEAGEVLRKMVVDPNRHEMLQARRLWLLGLVESRLGRLQQSVQLSQDALEILIQHRDLAAVASINVNLAAPLDELSQPGRAWFHRLQGLRASSTLSSFRLRHVALFDAAEQLVEMGGAEPAQLFLAELVRNAQEWGPATALLESHLLYASALSTVGRHSEAAEQLTHAGKAASELQDRDRVLRLSADISVERAEILIATDPGEALEELERSLKIYQAFDYRYPLVRVHRLRGVAARRMGWNEKAGEAYRAAVTAHESVLAALETPEHRAGYLVHASDAYESLLHHLAVQLGDAEEAFVVLGKSRSVWSPGRVGLDVGLHDLQARLSADAGLLAFHVLADETLVWSVGPKGSDLTVLPVGRGEIVPQVERHEAEMALSGAELGSGSATAWLYQRLIEPLARHLDGVRRLAVMPDRLLGRVSFAGLFDPLSGRYLIDSVSAMSIVPSAGIATAPVRPPSRSGIVAVGNPAFDQALLPSLRPLPAAAREARQIADLYPDSALLIADEARVPKIREELRGRRVLHFAGHAFSTPLHSELSGLVMAPDRGDDGILTVEEVESLSLEGLDLVVLSACRTSAGERAAHQDWAEALLGAGVRGVVANRWQIDDEAAARFFLRFHELRITGLSDPEALLTSQRYFRNEPPRVWAGFSYYGPTE